MLRSENGCYEKVFASHGVKWPKRRFSGKKIFEKFSTTPRNGHEKCQNLIKMMLRSEKDCYIKVFAPHGVKLPKSRFAIYNFFTSPPAEGEKSVKNIFLIREMSEKDC